MGVIIGRGGDKIRDLRKKVDAIIKVCLYAFAFVVDVCTYVLG